MLQDHVCPKCKYNRILYVAQVADHREYASFPAKVAIARTGTGLLGGVKTQGEGELSACVCRQCGYTELYTKDPQAIPIDGEFVRELVGPAPGETPYR